MNRLNELMNYIIDKNRDSEIVSDQLNKDYNVLGMDIDRYDLLSYLGYDSLPNGINIYVGSETDLSEDVSVIKTKYNIDGEEGTIAIIGPKRMEYDRVVALLDYIKNNLGGDNE